MIALFDRELRHRFVSESIERVTGRPRLEFIGKTNRELGMPPELCARWDGTLKRVIERGEIVHDKFDFPGTGGVRHFEVTLEPELDDNGAVVQGRIHRREQYSQSLCRLPTSLTAIGHQRTTWLTEPRVAARAS
ncbi:PAS domain-containing protein [Piscinibacter sp.]|uniref:PAS domain-containing protein n=1 Tax=Piscinibacter sp. TaxID=1903157 RepID=UPI002B7ED9A8|nr:PAS domain-containing protein [Albitalea sp.]HUG26355.1 PAS domain-containing protein [Albitalea sp.]